MSLLSKHLFGQSFQVLKSFPLHLLFCSFMKLCSFPFKGCFCHLKPKWNTWSIKTPLFSWRTSAMLLHRSSTRNLISWDSNSSFSCFSCCCACVLQHCNKFYLQDNHGKSKSQDSPTASWEDARSAASSLSTSWITTEIQTRNCRIAKLPFGSSFKSIFTGKRIWIIKKGDISASWLLSKSDDLDYELVVKTSFWPIFSGLEKLSPAPALL